MYGCLLLPGFYLQAALRWRELGGALAVVEGEATDCVVIEANAEARRQGVEIGMTPPQAQARCGALQILSRSPAQEQCLHDLLIEMALSLSPWLELASDGACLVDLTQTGRAVCWQELGDSLHARGREQGLHVRVGLSTTPDLAALAAEGARPVSIVYDPRAFVAELPLSALHPSPALARILGDWGVHTVGQFLDLPAGDTIQRLGPEAQELRQKMSGRHRRTLQFYRKEPKYGEAFDFDYEVDTAEPLLFLLRRFLETLTGRLRTVYRVARELRLRIPLENGTHYERSFSIPSPTAEVEVLFRILQGHLETLQLELRPVGVRLEIEAAAQVRDQLCLFESTLRDPNQFGETLGRLKALLGNDCVGVPLPCDSHQPDRFQLADTFPTEKAATVTEKNGLPLRRFRPPLKGRVGCRGGEPVQVEAAGIRGTIRQAMGPYFLSGHWWDVNEWMTAEWDVELTEGGMYRISCQLGEWLVEGAYELR